MDTKERYYESIANYHKSSLLITKQKAVVQLENYSDRVFWEKLLKGIYPNESFLYLAETRTEKGAKASGSSNCLRFRKFLDVRFVIAIDSDLHYLLEEEGFDTDHFILQTYTYSLENHLCFHERLQEVAYIAAGATKDDFDFKIFLEGYSGIVYPLLLQFLAIQKIDKSYFTMSEFERVINLPYMHNRIENNGQELLNELQRRVSEQIGKLTEYPSLLGSLKSKYANSGISAGNSYLYVRGHNLYNLMMVIGKDVSSAVSKKQKGILIKEGKSHLIGELYASKKDFERCCNTSALYWDYPLIQKCINDCKSIWA